MCVCVCVHVQNGSVNVDSVVTVAARLAEAGHYGAERISLVSSRLQEDWKSLTTALEERSNTLAMATGFHQGAEQVINTPSLFCENIIKTSVEHQINYR